MQSKTEKRIGALRRRLADAEKYEGDKDKEEKLRTARREIYTLRKRIPYDILLREGLL